MIYLVAFLVSLAGAQESPDVLPQFEESLPTSLQLSPLAPVIRAQNDLPNILIIGYWPPTNDMVRAFNPNTQQNPEGWIGENWEGRGYNIYALHGEFGKDTPQGEGLFQVDYQRTSEDFWRIIPSFQPVALLSFGRAHANNDWEIEMLTRNLMNWVNDFVPPLRPQQLPPDRHYERNGARHSQFPADNILKALNEQVPSLNAFADANGAGAYLCEYLGFHLSWYREVYPRQVQFAAHTHIGSTSKLEDLKKGVKVSLRALIDSLEK